MERHSEKKGNVTVLDRETVLIRYDDATRVLWGDETCHQVSDWVYGKGERIAPFMFSLRSGEYFKWSKKWKPRYDQHRLYYFLEGQLSIHDPESGEVARADAGEAIFWTGLRWQLRIQFWNDGSTGAGSRRSQGTPSRDAGDRNVVGKTGSESSREREIRPARQVAGRKTCRIPESLAGRRDYDDGQTRLSAYDRGGQNAVAGFPLC